MESVERRAPAFCDQSEAYSLFRRGREFLAAGHPGQAALYLARALSLEPGRNSIREALARAEFALGRYEHAAALFAAVAEQTPDDHYAQYGLARCLRELGRREEARAHLRLARAMHPTSGIYTRPLEGIE